MRQLALRPPTWGGKRDGAGRKRGAGHRSVPHAGRPPHDARYPVHVTLRACSGVLSLRDEKLLRTFRAAFRAANRTDYRLVAFTVQADHLHLVVEADGPTAFVRGTQGLAIRVAKAVNQVLRRHGRVWSERYHARDLRTPSEVRAALVYVLNNFRKHVRAAVGLDPYSSARWFDGWATEVARPDAPSPVVAARTWLGRVGWRRAGPIDPNDAPHLPRRQAGRRSCVR
jgi:putative transposase